jgi:hypothetical protein
MRVNSLFDSQTGAPNAEPDRGENGISNIGEIKSPELWSLREIVFSSGLVGIAPLTVGRFAKILKAVRLDSALKPLPAKNRSRLFLNEGRGQPSAKRAAFNELIPC